jgi:hypothetical protein
MKSWVLDSSLDGCAWTGIDRKTDNEDFKASLKRTTDCEPAVPHMLVELFYQHVTMF